MPIRRKLTIVILVCAASAVLLAGTAGMVYEFVRYHGAIIRDLTTQADIIGDASAAALAFQDRKAAQETLVALHVRPEIMSARLFGSDGREFAAYVRTDLNPADVPATRVQLGPVFELSRLRVCRTVALAGQDVGTICLQADLREQQARLRTYAMIAGVIIVLALLMAFIVAHRLQRFITEPLLALTGLTRDVAARADFSVRAMKSSDDEIGRLTDDFNRMLARIQHGEESLRSSEERFRQVTENIREVFWMTDLEKTQMIYVSRAYEEIWGWPVGSLYAEPRSWSELIHPEDRAGVRAALGKQVAGKYDEQYRIVRPDGTVRWIRDRAYPVRDPNGVVYRIAGIAEDITELKRAQEAVRFQSEVTGNMQEGVVVVRASDERIVYVNRKFEEMFGYDPGELIAKPVAIVNAEAEKSSTDVAREIISNLEQTGLWSGEVHNRRKDGTPFWCFMNISTFQHPEYGKVWIAVHTDITERRRAEHALRETEQRLEAIIDNSTAVIYAKDVEGRYVLINQWFETLFHVRRDDVVGKTDRDLFPRERADAFRENDLEVLKSRRSQLFEEVAPQDDGLHTFISVKFPLYDGADEPYAVCGISTDITDRKRAEEALQTQARVLESMLEGVFVYDDDEHIVLTNPALESMFGYEQGELVGQSTFVLNPFPAESCAQIAAEIRKCLQAHPSVERQFRNRRKDGSEFVSESRISRLHIAGQNYNVAVVQDVTERKRLEREILEISEREQARIAQDLHDGLCQQLIIAAFAANSLAQKLPVHQLPEKTEATAIARLIDNTITAARNVARELYPVRVEAEGLPAALQELTRSMAHMFGVPCSLDCPQSVELVDKNGTVHLYRIAQEAITNAAKHGKPRNIEVIVRQDHQHVVLTVHDDGIGLPATAVASHGLGLHIMRYRAGLIGGTLQIQSDRTGTTVTCSVPCSTPR